MSDESGYSDVFLNGTFYKQTQKWQANKGFEGLCVDANIICSAGRCRAETQQIHILSTKTNNEQNIKE